jgi:hypothetical protein
VKVADENLQHYENERVKPLQAVLNGTGMRNVLLGK